MTEEDLRDCFAMIALVGAMMMPDKRYDAKAIWQIADDMIEARKKEKENEEDIGIVAVVPKRTRKR